MSWDYPHGAAAQLDRALMGATCSMEHYDARSRLDLRPVPAEGRCVTCDRHLREHHTSYSDRGNCPPCEWRQLEEEGN